MMRDFAHGGATNPCAPLRRTTAATRTINPTMRIVSFDRLGGRARTEKVSWISPGVQEPNAYVGG
jgi:hypothetical protein